jgi:ribonuclease R
MSTDWSTRLLELVTKPGYKPQTVKALAKRLQVPPHQKNLFRDATRQLVRQGALSFGKNHTVHSNHKPHLVPGTIKVTASGVAFVRPEREGEPDIFIPAFAVGDAMSGDMVMVELARGGGRQGPRGVVADIVERGKTEFVGVYNERGGQGYVVVDGGLFADPIHVGDAGAKGARNGAKVVLEMVRFPSPDHRGEGVIIEVLGEAGDPGVDTLSVIRAFGIPDRFSEAALNEARAQAAQFDENDLSGRRDFTQDLVITIDPVDARDFDDAVAVRFDPVKKHWHLDVHIADVAHFVPIGGTLDKEARERATSVYLPQKVVPMLPEMISNHLASLQEGQLRYVMSALMEFDAKGEPLHAEFHRGAIRVNTRFTYEQVSAFYADYDAKHPSKRRQKDSSSAALPPAGTAVPAMTAETAQLLLRLRDFALTLRKRRYANGSLELSMPEIELEYDEAGKVIGAHHAVNDISHQVIEECMLAANEAVATLLDKLDVPFLRRIHPAPEPLKLEDYLAFIKALGYDVNRKTPTDRFQLQRILKQSAERPEQHAVHFGMLKSLKQAVYSPEDDGHYALAIKNYCHFTSPIRRYPDLTIHRQLTRWIMTRKVKSDVRELASLGEHCSDMERRADKAENELIKVRLLDYLSDKLGSVWKAVITSVESFGFFCEPIQLPADGLVRVATLTDDYYHYDDATHSLIGSRYKKRYRLGDTVWVEVARVDVHRRRLDYRVVDDPSKVVSQDGPLDEVEEERPRTQQRAERPKRSPRQKRARPDREDRRSEKNRRSKRS